ncbi:SRPBCC family protein [Paeniglutamicibacter sp. NPDC091659]|uniref:SRPBCC family protein n=1 Tax=Paeniglutamicibacter sp. NPDC091659 TaxID=3364389 RepID=UPI0038074C1E
MKFTIEVPIDAPVEHVLALLAKPNHALHRQASLQRIEHRSGTPGEAGSTSTYHYRLPNGREVAGDETLLRKDPDGTEESLVKAKGLEHRVLSRVVAAPDGTARWVMENDMRFTGPMSFTAFFFGPSIRRQARLVLDEFARWAQHSYRAEGGS